MNIFVIIAMSLTVIMAIMMVIFFKVSFPISTLFKKERVESIINDQVAKAMAQKIVSDAKMHRKNRFMDDE